MIFGACFRLLPLRFQVWRWSGRAAAFDVHPSSLARNDDTLKVPLPFSSLTVSIAMASSQRGPNITERDPLLTQPYVKDAVAPQASPGAIPVFIARRLYLSHFLSTWNSRVFEFGAVLYLAAVFPETLLPMSVYAFTRALSAIIFAPAVGQYIDTGNRLQVVRVSIGMSFRPDMAPLADS